VSFLESVPTHSLVHRVQTNTGIDFRDQKCTYTHTHLCTRAYTHTCTCVHTHSLSLSLPLSQQRKQRCRPKSTYPSLPTEQDHLIQSLLDDLLKLCTPVGKHGVLTAGTADLHHSAEQLFSVALQTHQKVTRDIEGATDGFEFECIHSTQQIEERPRREERQLHAHRCTQCTHSPHSHSHSTTHICIILHFCTISLSFSLICSRTYSCVDSRAITPSLSCSRRLTRISLTTQNSLSLSSYLSIHLLTHSPNTHTMQHTSQQKKTCPHHFLPSVLPPVGCSSR
jgi:hypothetical protein